MSKRELSESEKELWLENWLEKKEKRALYHKKYDTENKERLTLYRQKRWLDQKEKKSVKNKENDK